MPFQEDTQLVQRLRGGDLSAFDELYLKYYALLCTNAYFFLKNEQEAKDLVQTLFLDLWDKQLYNNFHEDVRGYLFRAVKNRCMNHFARQKIRTKKEQGYTAIILQEEDGLPPLEANGDCYGQLHSALEEMPSQKKAAIRMVYLHGKKYQDAADTMRISINSLKTHLRTGLRILRGEIKSRIN
jgi:RNA polymerase sigma-70 factor (ECF subfamily)